MGTMPIKARPAASHNNRKTEQQTEAAGKSQTYTSGCKNQGGQREETMNKLNHNDVIEDWVAIRYESICAQQ